jgi:hypothetical protein
MPGGAKPQPPESSGGAAISDRRHWRNTIIDCYPGGQVGAGHGNCAEQEESEAQKEPPAGQAAMRECHKIRKIRKCATEWKEAKTAGKVEKRI